MEAADDFARTLFSHSCAVLSLLSAGSAPPRLVPSILDNAQAWMERRSCEPIPKEILSLFPSVACATLASRQEHYQTREHESGDADTATAVAIHDSFSEACRHALIILVRTIAHTVSQQVTTCKFSVPELVQSVVLMIFRFEMVFFDFVVVFAARVLVFIVLSHSAQLHGMIPPTSPLRCLWQHILAMCL